MKEEKIKKAEKILFLKKRKTRKFIEKTRKRERERERERVRENREKDGKRERDRKRNPLLGESKSVK